MAARHHLTSRDSAPVALMSQLVPGPSLLRQVVVVVSVLVAGFALVVVPRESFRRSYNDWRHTRMFEGRFRLVNGPQGWGVRQSLCQREGEALDCQRSLAATVALGDGRVLVWGGRGAGADSGAIYDPVTDAWERLPAAPGPPRFQAATVWTGREALILGGGTDSGLSGIDSGGIAFNPSTRTWRELPAAPVGLVGARAVALDGGVLVAGGDDGNYPSRPVSMWLDLDKNSWTLVPAPVSAVNLARDGDRVLATGPVALSTGNQTWWPSTSNGRTASGWPVVAFDPARMAWERVADPIDTRWMAVAVAGDGTLTALTMEGENEPLRAYVWTGGAWHHVAETARGARAVSAFDVVMEPTATLWTGRLLLVGSEGHLTSWDPSARQFATAHSSSDSSSHTAVVADPPAAAVAFGNFEGIPVWTGAAAVALSNQSPEGWVWTPARR